MKSWLGLCVALFVVLCIVLCIALRSYSFGTALAQNEQEATQILAQEAAANATSALGIAGYAKMNPFVMIGTIQFTNNTGTSVHLSLSQPATGGNTAKPYVYFWYVSSSSSGPWNDDHKIAMHYNTEGFTYQLSPGTWYFRVRVSEQWINPQTALWTPVASVTLTPLSMPNYGITGMGMMGQINLARSFSAQGGVAPYSYAWYRSTNPNAPFGEWTYCGVHNGGWGDSNLQRNTNYYYKIMAVDSATPPEAATALQSAASGPFNSN